MKIAKGTTESSEILSVWAWMKKLYCSFTNWRREPWDRVQHRKKSPLPQQSVSTACHFGRLGMLELAGVLDIAWSYKESTLPSTFKISVNLTRAQRMLAGWYLLFSWLINVPSPGYGQEDRMEIIYYVPVYNFVLRWQGRPNWTKTQSNAWN